MSEYKEEIKNLKAMLPDAVTKSGHASDAHLLRFLKFHEFNVKEAKDAIVAYVSWKTHFKVHLVNVAEIEEEVRKDCITLLDKLDKEGRPVLHVRWKNFHPADVDPIVFRKQVIYIMERIMNLTPMVDSFVVLADYDGWALAQTSPALTKVAVDQAKLYPLVPHTYCINAPWYFRAMWKVISPFLSAKTTEYLKLVGDKDARAAMGDAVVPVKNGGAYPEEDMAAYLQRRADVERVQLGVKNPELEAAFVNAAKDLEMPYTEALEGSTFNGKLFKQGSGGYFGTTSWKERYFVLRKDQLYYYPSKSDKQPNRIYHVGDCQCIRLDRHDAGGQNHAFTIAATGAKVNVAAKSENVMEEWIAKLEATKSDIFVGDSDI